MEDQIRIGYARATKGRRLENVIKNIPFFMQTLWEILPGALVNREMRSPDFLSEMKEISALLFENIKIIASSFVQTREDIINEKVSQLTALFEFTREIIAANGLEEIVSLLFEKAASLLDAEFVYIALYKSQMTKEILWWPEIPEDSQLIKNIKNAWDEGVPLFIDEENIAYKDVELFKLKRTAAIPIQIHGSGQGAIAFCSKINGFRFTKKEMDYLYQFIHTTAAALEHTYMLRKIEQNSRELKLITSKMVNIQEEERRRLAEDIHDTVAQSLAGISYKLQFCRELIHRDPELLAEQFDKLLITVNNTVDQSRELIANLRPNLIDTAGLVPAVQRYFDSYQLETGIKVQFDLNEDVTISSDYSICLFRVIQEALVNVFKHAETDRVDVLLSVDQHKVTLVIVDRGIGFDMSSGAPWIKNPDKLGLLSMKERIEAVGGGFNFQTGINKGCRIEATVDLSKGANKNAEN